MLKIGPRTGVTKRDEYEYGQRAAADIKFSRLLAEHGMFGVVALAVLLLLPLMEFFRRRQRPEWNFLLIALVLSTFAFMVHSATRTGLPMFMYGLAFCYLLSPADMTRITISAFSHPKYRKPNKP